MDNYKKVSLRSIILDYAKSQNIILDGEDLIRSYVKDRTREIKELCKCINLNIDQFKDRDKKTYTIPYDVATVISVYLRQDSRRGSVISRMKAGKYSQITDDEKKNIFDELFTSLRTSAQEENDTSLLIAIDFLEKQYDGVLKQNERRKDAINEIVGSINNVIIRAVNAVVGLDDSAGLMVYYNGRHNDENPIEIDDKVEYKLEEENREKAKTTDVFISNAKKYQSDFNYDDQIELIKHLKTVMINAVMEWTEIVDIAHEIRKEDILEQCMKNMDGPFFETEQMSMEEVHTEMNNILDNMFSSEELVSLAIKEYDKSEKPNVYKTKPDEKAMDSVKNIINKR